MFWPECVIVAAHWYIELLNAAVSHWLRAHHCTTGCLLPVSQTSSPTPECRGCSVRPHLGSLAVASCKDGRCSAHTSVPARLACRARLDCAVCLHPNGATGRWSRGAGHMQGKARWRDIHGAGRPAGAAPDKQEHCWLIMVSMALILFSTAAVTPTLGTCLDFFI